MKRKNYKDQTPGRELGLCVDNNLEGNRSKGIGQRLGQWKMGRLGMSSPSTGRIHYRDLLNETTRNKIAETLLSVDVGCSLRQNNMSALCLI